MSTYTHYLNHLSKCSGNSFRRRREHKMNGTDMRYDTTCCFISSCIKPAGWVTFMTSLLFGVICKGMGIFTSAALLFLRWVPGVISGNTA